MVIPSRHTVSEERCMNVETMSKRQNGWINCMSIYGSHKLLLKQKEVCFSFESTLYKDSKLRGFQSHFIIRTKKLQNYKLRHKYETSYIICCQTRERKNSINYKWTILNDKHKSGPLNLADDESQREMENQTTPFSIRLYVHLQDTRKEVLSLPHQSIFTRGCKYSFKNPFFLSLSAWTAITDRGLNVVQMLLRPL